MDMLRWIVVCIHSLLVCLCVCCVVCFVLLRCVYEFIYIYIYTNPDNLVEESFGHRECM